MILKERRMKKNIAMEWIDSKEACGLIDQL